MRQTQLSRNSVKPRYQQNETATTLRSVWQDKTTPRRDRIATLQPAPRKNMMRPHQMKTDTSRSQKQIKKRKTVSMTLWVKPQLKAEIQRIATLEGLSVSRTGNAGLEEWVRQQLHIQHTVLIQPIIETTIRNELRRYFSRMILFLARITMTIDVMKGLVKWLCRMIAGVTKEQVDAVEARSRTDARLNLLKRTPQLEAITKELEQTLMEGIV
jgi:hypothetical protein